MNQDKQEKRYHVGNPGDSLRAAREESVERLSASSASRMSGVKHPANTTNELLGDANKLLEERLSAIENAIVELKKPHWSVKPSFILLVAAVFLTAVGAAASVASSLQAQQLFHLAWLFPQPSAPAPVFEPKVQSELPIPTPQLTDKAKK